MQRPSPPLPQFSRNFNIQYSWNFKLFNRAELFSRLPSINNDFGVNKMYMLFRRPPGVGNLPKDAIEFLCKPSFIDMELEFQLVGIYYPSGDYYWVKYQNLNTPPPAATAVLSRLRQRRHRLAYQDFVFGALVANSQDLTGWIDQALANTGYRNISANYHPRWFPKTTRLYNVVDKDTGETKDDFFLTTHRYRPRRPFIRDPGPQTVTRPTKLRYRPIIGADGRVRMDPTMASLRANARQRRIDSMRRPFDEEEVHRYAATVDIPYEDFPLYWRDPNAYVSPEERASWRNFIGRHRGA